MITPSFRKEDFIACLHEHGTELNQNAIESDISGEFVEKNYQFLKENKFFSAVIPVDLGGEGIRHEDMCEILRTLAGYCGSTALALSMHQHLVAALVWKYKQGKGGEATLRNIADKQLVLISTGARDWLESNGKAEKVDGGYRYTGSKYFASQSSGGDIVVSSAPVLSEESDGEVIHFAIPIHSEGIQVDNNWDTLGMRGTGSNTIHFKNVFIPETAISLKRPQGRFHPFFNVVLTVAMPYIMSVYQGLAQKSFHMCLTSVKKSKTPKQYHSSAIAEVKNELVNAECNYFDMIKLTNNLNFEALEEFGQNILIRKTNCVRSCERVVKLSFELCGGQSYFKSFGLERILRDMQAANFHPLSEKDQLEFTGEYLLRNQD